MARNGNREAAAAALERELRAQMPAVEPAFGLEPDPEDMVEQAGKEAYGGVTLVEPMGAPGSDGAAELVTQTCAAIGAAHDFAIADIEAMITRLSNLKSVLELKKAATQEALADFIGTIGHGMTAIGKMDGMISAIEEKHLTV